MKKFVDKLIGRLEGLKTYYAEDFSQGYSCEVDCVEKYEVKKIVNELAEEYINTSTDTSTDTSSGWIPCSERTPDIEGNTSDTVLVCTIDGFQHMAFWCDDEKWRYCESGMIKKPMEWTEIIAWMPLPAPYKEGE